MAMSKKLSGYVVPWSVVRCQDKYYLMTDKLDPLPSPKGTSTAQIKQSDSGIVVSIHPDDLEKIDDWHRLGKDFVEVTLEVDEGMPSDLEMTLASRDYIVSLAGNRKKELADYFLSLVRG